MPILSGGLLAAAQFKRLVKKLHGAGCVLLPYNDREVQFGRTLSDHLNINRRRTKRTEGSGGNTGRAFNTLADQSDDGDLRNRGDAVDTPAINLPFKLPA